MSTKELNPFCSFGLIFGKSGSGKTTLLQVRCFISSLYHTQLSGIVLLSFFLSKS